MKIKLALLILVAGLFCTPLISLATDYGDITLTSGAGVSGGLVPCGNNANGTEDACTLCHFVVGFQNLIDFMLKLVVTVGFVGIFASGVVYIISAGDDKLITSAKSALTASIVGFAIVLGAWLIVNVTIWAFSADIGASTGQNWYEIECSVSNPVVTTTTSSDSIADTASADISEGGNCGTSDYGDGICTNGWFGNKCPNGGNYLRPDKCESGMYCCVY